MDYWARPKLDRNQALLFYPTLDSMLKEGHEVRDLDELLHGIDWGPWESHYHGRVGQPPIHPRVLSSVIFYGLMRSIRSSRVLEYSCGHNVDFIWLAEGLVPDHTTLCKFRTRFEAPLKELYKEVCRLGIKLGLVQLVELAFDGTRIKANASRCRTWTAKRVEEALQELDQQLEKKFQEMKVADEASRAAESENGQGEATATTQPETAAEVFAELMALEQKKESLEQTLENLRQADAARKKDGINPTKNPAQLPKADQDSRVMSNKEGGYAPNYTPVAATDASGFIVDCEVLNGPNEHNELLPSVDRIEENFGKRPESMSADKAFGTAKNLEGMEAREVNFHTPVASPEPQDGNPAKRDDPRQPVAEADWPALPRNNRQKLDKCCFIYDQANDCYYCPMGQPLPYAKTKDDRVYRCENCAGCPLAGQCLDPKAKRGRTITRDGYEPLRQAMYAKMQTEAGKTTYGRRMHIGETPFAVIKGLMGVRRFLLRGLEKVRTEWRWVCTAYNLRKLMTALAKLRAEGKPIALSVKN